MAKMRVHDLAKEYGMQSKELLEHLADMKIPAKSASSTLEDAYISIVRKKLQPIMEARAAEIAAQKAAEEEAAAKEAKAAAEAAEAERLAAEARREAERAEEEKKRAKEEAARKKEEERRRAEEEKKRLEAEEAERNRVKDTAPKAAPSFNNLLDQIAQQEEVLKQQAAESAAQKKAEKGPRNHARANASEASGAPSRHNFKNERDDASMSDERPNGKRKKNRRGGDDGEDRYSRMAREAEAYNRSRVLDEARVAIEEASRESTGRRKKRKERRQKQAAEAAMEQRIEEALANDQDISQLDTVKVPQGSTVSELAELLGVPANDIIKRLFLLGNPLTLTETMSDELIEIVADDLGRQIKIMSKEEENSFTFYDDPKDLKPRPPVVTVMGHVDHGKTRLLDAIRNTNVIEGEAGGITQHIGAYQVHTTVEGEDRAITFIDTPGHEAFTAMRARGAKVTDVAILVVAADDGVMPQTVEALNHAQAANVPIVVAVNKIDKEGASPEKIRGQLTEYGLIPEEYGGDTMFVDVSARNGTNIDELLEAVTLTADVLELTANPNKEARGVAIEANLDKGRGAVCTVLVQSGTLRVGDAIVAGVAHGRVRAMFDENGQAVKEAGPSRPVQVLGLSTVPRAGDTFLSTEEERTARQIAEKREAADRNAQLAKRRKRVTLESFDAAVAEGKMDTLNLIIKGDVSGAVEALEESLMKIDAGGDEVQLRVIHRGVGAITQNDVNLATVDNAVIIGFNVRPAERVAELADREGVEMKFYSVIYRAIEEIEQAVKGMLKPEYEEVELGSAEIREVFRSSKWGNIAGSIVKNGIIKRNAKARLVRDGSVVADNLTIESLRRFKDDATEVREGFECGIGLGSFNDIKEGDIIETWEMREKPRV